MDKDLMLSNTLPVHPYCCIALCFPLFHLPLSQDEEEAMVTILTVTMMMMMSSFSEAKFYEEVAHILHDLHIVGLVLL